MKLICQNCNVQYEKIKDLKSHVRSYKHKQEVAKLFQTAVHKGPVYFPMFIFLDYLRNPNQTDPIIGFDMVTMFITPEKIGALYLCHVCEKALSTADVVEHLCSGQHYFNYFASTNPEFLRFAWLSDAFSYLQSHATKEYNNKGPGSLRVYDLAKMVMRKCKKLHYHQVMAVLSKTDKLMEHIQAGIPRRKSIQEYITDPARANPLLGLNLFIEYSCPNNKGYCGYLCIVCKKNISANQSISHCISFDHIYWYLKAAHPTTLVSPKSSYSNYSPKFQKEILNLAKQAQTVCPSTEVQTVHVDLECFKVVKTSSFANALEKLKGIVKEKNLSELNVSVAPGKRIMFAPEDHESPASTATTETLAKQPEEKVQKGPATQTKDDPPCKVMCVECDKTLDFIINYKGHIKGKQHKQKLTELFGPGQYSGAIPQIKLYQYMWNRHGKQSSRPVIGLSLITVFIHRQSVDINVPFYICHACELNIPVSSASIHLTSTQHYFNVFSYSKPDFVFLGSWNLDHFAQEEERRQGKRNMVLHVCELPRQLFTDLRILAYDKIMEKIGIHFAKLKKSIQVEKRVTVQTYSKSCERKSPLLGLQFVVKCTTTNNHYSRCIYMCLLCEKMLPERHAIAHLLSFPHIFAYLDVAHHGSLSKEDSEQKALVMDLAQQAEKINPNTSLREVDLSFGTFNEIEKNSFKAAVNVLQVAFRNKGLGELKPPAVPGAKLISSFEKNKESNSSECKKQGQTSLDMEKLNTDEANTNATMPKTEEKGSSDCPDLLHTKHEELQKTTCIPSTHIQPAEPSLAPARSDWPPSELSIPSLDTLKSEPLKLDQKSLSQQKLPDRISTQDPPTVQQPQPQDSIQDVPEQQNAKLVQKPVELVEALQKAAETETPVVPQTQSSTCTELRSYLKMPNRPPVIGLQSVIECCSAGQQPFYMCSICVERCEKSTIINHLLSNNHRLQYLESVGYSPEPGESKAMSSWLLTQADMVEKMQGCGEAMTVTLDAKDYHEVSSEPILTALGKLRDSLHKLMSESSAQNPKAACSDDDKSDESHGPETFKRVRKSKEQNSPCSDLKEALKSTEPNTSKQDDPAQTSKDLWTYLTSSTRKEPVIGLSMITEYRNQNGQNSFLCSCCKVILSTSKYPGHLISPRHRFNYIKIKYPDFVAHWKAEISLTDNIKELQKKAQVVQDTEGWGCLKIVEKENKQPQKRSQEPSEDTENATLAKLKKQEPSNTSDAEKSAPNLELPQTGGGAEPQDQKNSEPKLKKQQQKKFTKRNAVIGLNFVTCVHHGKKKLFFCELCSVRGDFDHMSSVIHRKTYVKHKYPDWNASSPNMEKKLHKISLRLAAVERSTGRGMKKLNVTANVFIALSTAPLNEALSQLKLLQTKPEDGVEHNEPSTFSDHEQGTCHNSVDHLKSSATTANSLQQDESVLLGNHVISAPVYEPISPPPASDCKSVPSVTPLYSSTHLTFLKLSNNLKWKEPSDVAHHETGPGADSGGAGGLQHSPSAFPCSPLCGHFTCCQSILKEENSLLLDNAPSKTYCFPNLPTVVGQSNASIFLGVKGLFNKDPIIGLANILECQAILQPTFFLCLNCAEKVSRENFCHHMTSERHIHLTIRTQYHEIFQRWQMTPHVTIRDFAEKLALTEKGLDAKVIKLTKTQYESLCSADFNDAIVILQRMYGPRLDKSSLPSHLGVQNQENHEISTVRLAARSVEAAKERENQSQQSCDKTTQNQEHHSVHVPLKEFNHALGNLGSKTTTCTSTDNHLQTESQNPPQTLPESDAQTAKPQHQVVVQIDLTAESDDSMTKLSIHTPKQITERAKEKHVKDCSNSTALETPQTAAVDLQESRPATMFPCTATIKQEKTGHDEGSCGDDIPLTLEANSSKEPTGNIFKHSDLRYSNKNRTEADAVVGLSAMIECRCEGKASLYLCVSCSRKLNHDLFRYHLLKYRHRYSYLKKRYPSLFEDWSDSDSIPDWSMRLMRLAHKVEMTNEDEPGQLQVIKLNCNEYNEIKAMSYDKAITHLQKIRKEQNLCGLQTCISPKITEKLIKQERMETDVTTPYSSQLPELIAQESGRAFKRRAVEQDLPRQSFPGQKQASNVPFNHMNQSPPVGNNPEPSDCPAKRSKISGNDTDSVAQVQTESSNSTTINANFTPVIVTETSRSSPQSFDPSSMTYNGTGSVDKTVLKNSDGKESLSSIIAPQQKDSCPDASTINAIGPTKGLEIARLSEKRPLAKKSLSENAWNYENRQFSPEKNSMTNTNPMPDSSTEMVAMKKQCIPYSVHNYNQALNPHYNWQIPSKNPDPNLTNLHLSVVSGYGTPTSATSQMTPEYVVSPLYPMYMHSGYPSVSNTMAPEYLGPVEQKAINYQSAASCISTNGTNSANTNSAQTLHTVDQAQQVYQQIQSIQDPATCQAYYAWYSYNQTLHSNQAADNGNATSTPTFEHGVYPLFSWLQKKN